MTLDKLKAPITSKEDYERALYAAGLPLKYRTLSSSCGNSVAPFWLEREHSRLTTGIYTGTEVTNSINQEMPHLAVHVSVIDPECVAYTPDAESGKRDKQLKITLGKLLTRLYPWVPDPVIASKVADHKAELSLEVEFISGPEIAQVYQTALQSCMTLRDVAAKAHPALAYDAPNIRLAVIRKEGAITARCLVYEPSEADKRYIRGYGDPKLVRKLERLGYRAGSFIGATFKTIPLGEGRYLFPYLDAEGGPGSYAGSCVALIDGELRGISHETYKKLMALNPRATTVATNTSKYLFLESLDSTQFKVTCVITGRVGNVLTDTVTEVYLAGAVCKALDVPETWDKVSVYLGGKSYVLYADSDLPRFAHKGRVWLDTEESRKANGYVKLNPVLYPDEQEWRHSSLGVQNLPDGRVVKAGDCVTVINPDGTFEQTLATLVTKEFTKVHSTTRNLPLYAKPGVTVLKTLTGRKVVKGFHEIVCLHDGTWAFTRQAKPVRLYGKTLYCLRNSRVPEFGPLSRFAIDATRELLLAQLESKSPYRAVAHALAILGLNPYVTDPDTGYRRQFHYFSYDPAMGQEARAKRLWSVILATHPDEPAVQTLRYVWETYQAEMQAVEPDQIVTQVPEAQVQTEETELEHG